MDLRLYKATGVLDTYSLDEITEGSLSGDTSTAGLEIITGKVVKYLLTYLGSDAFNPEYGGISMHHTQISEQYIPQLRIEVLDDLERCLKFIQDTEKSLDRSSDRLAKLRLLSITYNRQLSPCRYDVRIEITTTNGNSTVVDLGAANG